MSAASHTALRRCIEDQMNAAKEDYFRSVELCQQKKCSPLRLSYLQGVYDGFERAWRECVFAETDAKGIEVTE